MAINYPGPFEVRILYTASASSIATNHQVRFSMNMNTEADPGDPFSDWTAQSRLGATPQLDTWVDDLMALLQPLFNTTTSFSVAELWEYDPGTFNAAFRSSYALGLLGTSASPTIADSQALITFRSQLGGSARVDLRRTKFSEAVTDAYPFGDTDVQALANFISAVGSPVIARDGGYLFSPLNFLRGFNEKLSKLRLRP